MPFSKVMLANILRCCLFLLQVMAGGWMQLDMNAVALRFYSQTSFTLFRAYIHMLFCVSAVRSHWRQQHARCWPSCGEHWLEAYAKEPFHGSRWASCRNYLWLLPREIHRELSLSQRNIPGVPWQNYFLVVVSTPSHFKHMYIHIHDGRRCCFFQSAQMSSGQPQLNATGSFRY